MYVFRHKMCVINETVYGTSKAGQGNNQSWKGLEQSEYWILSQRPSHQVLF